MANIFNGRYTADIQGDFVVFVIGMRINKALRIDKWGPVASAMGPMLSTLYQHPEKGFLGGYTLLGWRTIVTMQYWRSTEDLERFARHPGDRTLARGASSTSLSAPTARSASSMRRIKFAPDNTRLCTATCRASGWRL